MVGLGIIGVVFRDTSRGGHRTSVWGPAPARRYPLVELTDATTALSTAATSTGSARFTM
jgi:hypothetical protein